MPRPPVVTIMGHVDHGKTSLLDAIRSTHVTAQEHGGITQHIGAYHVQVDGRSVTFLDTPGHEAFTAMRARGAKVTDIVVLVVAADDGVMPQTVEAINHARAAEVPIIVAVNKIDRPDADLERVKRGLSEYGLVAEDWGGDRCSRQSRRKPRKAFRTCWKCSCLQADILELKANPDKLARGTIVEAKLDRGRGPVATVLVQEGTLHVGDAFVCGVFYGKVRAMIDEQGRKVETAPPASRWKFWACRACPRPAILLSRWPMKRKPAKLRSSAKASSVKPNWSKQQGIARRTLRSDQGRRCKRTARRSESRCSRFCRGGDRSFDADVYR